MAGLSWHYVLKFIITGDAAVGKSSLLIRLTDQRFLANPDPTLGVEFGSKLITIPEENKVVKLQCASALSQARIPGFTDTEYMLRTGWDTAGTESFRSITRSYYRGAAGCLLVPLAYPCARHDHRFHDALHCTMLLYFPFSVFRLPFSCHVALMLIVSVSVSLSAPPCNHHLYSHNTTHSLVLLSTHPRTAPGFLNARTWLSDVRTHADPHLTCILVGNKVDLCTPDEPSKRQVTTDEAEMWAKEEGLLFVEASAKSGENVEAAFEAACRDILEKVRRGMFDDDRSPGVKLSKPAGAGNGLTLDAAANRRTGCCGS
ncbi:hypothetical protein EVG20_g8557 [Dentipellis fragilis]|uniref:Uncharacterized protein n=1 Tax=Dentipellis fragilis TaxID=205917 RepID=A0A4Y9Y682_9AGAM|nr:hypothetical protein EVG20_g8557 [Dentipellis fragilis]